MTFELDLQSSEETDGMELDVGGDGDNYYSNSDENYMDYIDSDSDCEFCTSSATSKRINIATRQFYELLEGKNISSVAASEIIDLFCDIVGLDKEKYMFRASHLNKKNVMIMFQDQSGEWIEYLAVSSCSGKKTETLGLTSTGEIANAVNKALHKYKTAEEIVGFCFDSTSTNSGENNGAVKLLKAGFRCQLCDKTTVQVALFKDRMADLNVEQVRLRDFACKQTLEFFKTLRTSSSFLNTDVEYWDPSCNRKVFCLKQKCFKVEAHQLRSVQFAEDFGSPIRVNFDSLLEIFRNLITEEIMQLIVDETCKYALQNGKQMEFDVKKLEAFLGTLIRMECHMFPSIRLYWSGDDNMRVDRSFNRNVAVDESMVDSKFGQNLAPKPTIY
ncbi:hypothetical protein ILUMI_10549 [Ignelater luminosus]|uniref:PiggyBac transposable element-derived protein domain-containing protein n=1 Tax=Ignelater luminosus TaxID=2038154 RepID=A0A8K0D204_IGNLU|nr:hypothetical protein ILUMI_10549 [Ignelater luminosus]